MWNIVQDSQVFSMYQVCTKYRASLRSMYHRWNKQQSAGPSSVYYTNERYLNTPDRSAKIDNLKTRVRKAEQTVRSLSKKISWVLKENVLTQIFSQIWYLLCMGASSKWMMPTQMGVLPVSFGMSNWRYQFKLLSFLLIPPTHLHYDMTTKYFLFSCPALVSGI